MKIDIYFIFHTKAKDRQRHCVSTTSNGFQVVRMSRARALCETHKTNEKLKENTVKRRESDEKPNEQPFNFAMRM